MADDQDIAVLDTLHDILGGADTLDTSDDTLDTSDDTLDTFDDTLDASAAGEQDTIGAGHDYQEGAPYSQELATTTWQRLTVLPRLERDEHKSPRLVKSSKRRYELQTVLGEGASGEVGLAMDQDIQRLVAVKRLKSRPGEAPAVMRFVDEIRLVGTLEHPNIVPIHDVGVDASGAYYFVMKYVEGETLESVIVKLAKGDREYHEKYTFDYRVRIFMKICEAVEFAHSKGVIHRDLKPANIMVGAHGEVMVMDWGIAKQVSSSTSESSAALVSDDDEVEGSLATSPPVKRMFETQVASIIGTPAYMSPEQAMGKTDILDERTDIYSLCALFYEFLALTSYLPPKKTIKELVLSVVTEEPKLAFFTRHPHQKRVPAQYSNFLVKGLAKEPDERYQTVVEMRQILQKVTEGYFGVMCPVSMIKRPVYGLLHFIDRFPNVTLTLVVLLATSLATSLLYALMR